VPLLLPFPARRRLVVRPVATLGAAAVLLAVGLAGPTPAWAAGAGPTAVDDAGTTQLGRNLTLPGAKNDVAGSAAIVPTRTVFPTDQLGSLPSGSRIYNSGRTLEVNHHGTFTVDPADGSVTFQPWTGLTGDVSARYRVTDANGATADGRLAVTVTAGPSSHDAFAFAGVPVTVNLLDSDVPGRNADGTPGGIDRTSARFPDQASGDRPITVSADRLTLTWADVGVFTLDGRGNLTFDPDPAFGPYSVTQSLGYTARDSTRAADGSWQHHSYTGGVRIGVNPNYVITKDDRTVTPFGTTVTLPGSLNDSNTNPELGFQPEDSRFLSFGQPGPGDYQSPDGRIRHYAGKGTFTIQDDGSVLFEPTPGYAGRTGVDLLVYNTEGDRGQETVEVTVQPGPTSVADTPTVKQDVTTTFSVLGNDVPGTRADGTPGAMDPTSVRFTDESYTNYYEVSLDHRTLTVPFTGVFTISATTGKVTFDPEPRFTGTVGPFSYGARDTVTTTDGRVVHSSVASTFTVTVAPVTPVAVNNWSNTTVGVPVEVPVLANDRAGDPSAPLDPTTVRLRLTGGGLPAGTTSSDYDHTITIPGRGVYHVRDDGVVVATPAPGFTGVIPTVRYDVRDTNGTMAVAQVTVGVAKASS
jgi:CshA-type fibril repeat protein